MCFTGYSTLRQLNIAQIRIQVSVRVKHNEFFLIFLKGRRLLLCVCLVLWARNCVSMTNIPPVNCVASNLLMAGSFPCALQGSFPSSYWAPHRTRAIRKTYAIQTPINSIHYSTVQSARRFSCCFNTLYRLFQPWIKVWRIQKNVSNKIFSSYNFSSVTSRYI